MTRAHDEPLLVYGGMKNDKKFTVFTAVYVG
jgi:hypothetical protein